MENITPLQLNMKRRQLLATNIQVGEGNSLVLTIPVVREDNSPIHLVFVGTYHNKRNTVEPDLIATEMLAFPSKSSVNKNDSDLIYDKAIPT